MESNLSILDEFFVWIDSQVSFCYIEISFINRLDFIHWNRLGSHKTIIGKLVVPLSHYELSIKEDEEETSEINEEKIWRNLDLKADWQVEDNSQDISSTSIRMSLHIQKLLQS